MIENSDSTVFLQASDSEELIPIPISWVNISDLLISMIDSENETIFLPNVTTLILKHVIQFFKAYNEEQMNEIPKPSLKPLTKVVQTAFTDLLPTNIKDLCDLAMAANYMCILPLMKLCFAAIASQFHRKSLKECYETFNIPYTEIDLVDDNPQEAELLKNKFIEFDNENP